MRRYTLALAILAPTLIAACASSTRDEMANGDPLEDVNRSIYGFNETVSRRVVAPAAEAIQSSTPEEGKDGAGQMLTRVANVFDNLGEPKNAVNGALQGNAGAVGTAAARFGLNTTVGLLGMYDVADGLGIEERDEDFGQTLGTWGAPSGPYLVAPIAGPTTTRDATGMVVDSVLNPVSLIPIPGGTAVTVAKTGVKAADAARDADDTAILAEGSNAYDTARRRYQSRRAAEIANLNPEPGLRADGIQPVMIEHRLAQPPASGARGAMIDSEPYLIMSEDPRPVSAAPAEIAAGAATEDGPRGLEIDIYPVEADGAPVNIAPGAGFAD